MQTSNIANRALREERVGHVWVEQLSNAQGTLRVAPFSTVRVRATGATTVTIDGVLAMTMSSGEIEYFCVGRGDPSNQDGLVDIVIAGANAFVQLAQNKDRQ